MFFDRSKIYLKAGDGGNGCISFRREKYVAEGGPNGGDGGNGGSIIIEVDPSLRTLIDFKYKRHYKADRGPHGKGSNMHGRNAEHLILKVPPGTLIRDENGELLADLVESGDSYVAAKGGRGGRGNARFKSNKNKAPQIAENGEPGEELWLILELKLLADVGLAGYPNAGKSTLISAVSAARPKIADYPFTTLEPNLGVVKVGYDSFVMADIPGLIDGAHIGAGLGHDFLKHLERTKLIVHVVDVGTDFEGLKRNPYEDYCKINEELRLYNANLAAKYQIVAANKMDLPGAEERLAEFISKLPEGTEVFPISAATGQGTQELVNRVAELLQEIQEPVLLAKEEFKITAVEDKERFIITRGDDGVFVISGQELERHFHMHTLDTDESLMRFHRILVKMGVIDELRRRGAKHGDIVRIQDMEFEFID